MPMPSGSLLALMGLGGGMGAGMPPPAPEPRRPSLVDLLMQLSNQEQPQQASSMGDLPQDERRRLRGQSLMALAASIGGAPSGRLGGGLAEGVYGMNEMQRQGIGEFNARGAAAQDQEREQLLRQVELERAMQDESDRELEEMRGTMAREKGAQLAGVVRDQMEEDDPRQAEIDVLETAGDTKGLSSLLDELREEREKRALAERYGVDPGDPIALDIAREEEKKRRGLGSYYQQPERAREGVIKEDAEGNFILIDQVTGAVTPTGVRGKSSATSQQEADQAEDFQQAVKLAQQRMTQRGNPDIPPPTGNFQDEVQAHYRVLQRMRAARKPAPMVSPLEGNPAEVPTSATGPGRGKPQQPQGTPDQVIALLPKDVIAPPGIRAAIAEDLLSGRKPKEIADEITLAYRRSQGQL